MDGVARRGHNARGVGVFCREEIHFSQESYLEWSNVMGGEPVGWASLKIYFHDPTIPELLRNSRGVHVRTCIPLLYNSESTGPMLLKFGVCEGST